MFEDPGDSPGMRRETSSYVRALTLLIVITIGSLLVGVAVVLFR